MRHARRQPGSVRSRAFATGWAACVALLHPGEAISQATGEREGLDEVVVTARKVAEDILRVPMSVQALSGEYLERRDLSNLYDLQYEVPGLVINNRGMFGAGISLRGVADEGGGGLAVAPHFNGVYLGRANLALARPFDLERVEVVKGPQGTLYGRNATGGSISLLSRAPDPEFNAAFEAASGTFETTRIAAHVNLPEEKFAVRFAVAAADGDGFIRNSVDDRRFAEEDYRAVRASVRANPTDALTIDATLQHVEDDGASGELWSPRPDLLPDPGDIHLTRVTIADPFQSTKSDFANISSATNSPGSRCARSPATRATKCEIATTATVSPNCRAVFAACIRCATSRSARSCDSSRAMARRSIGWSVSISSTVTNSRTST